MTTESMPLPSHPPRPLIERRAPFSTEGADRSQPARPTLHPMPAPGAGAANGLAKSEEGSKEEQSARGASTVHLVDGIRAAAVVTAVEALDPAPAAVAPAVAAPAARPAIRPLPQRSEPEAGAAPTRRALPPMPQRSGADGGAAAPRIRPLPPRGSAGAGVAAPAALAAPGARTAARTSSRKGFGVPMHVAVATGAAATLYAASLAGVATLQALTNAQQTAQEAPAVAAVTAMRDQHDRLEAALNLATTQYNDLATAYQTVVGQIGQREKSIGGLGKQVAGIEQGLAALNSASAAASSGGGGGGGGYTRVVSSGGGTRLVTIVQTVSVPSRPVSNGCTTASGKPC